MPITAREILSSITNTLINRIDLTIEAREAVMDLYNLIETNGVDGGTDSASMETILSEVRTVKALVAQVGLTSSDRELLSSLDPEQVENTLLAIGGDVSKIKEDVGVLASGMDAFNSEVTALENVSTTLMSRNTALASTVGSLQDAVKDAQLSFDAANDLVVTVSEKIEEVAESYSESVTGLGDAIIQTREALMSYYQRHDGVVVQMSDLANDLRTWNTNVDAASLAMKDARDDLLTRADARFDTLQDVLQEKIDQVKDSFEDVTEITLSQIAEHLNSVTASYTSWVQNLTGVVALLRQFSESGLTVSNDTTQILNAARDVTVQMQDLLSQTGEFQMWLSDQMRSLGNSTEVVNSLTGALASNLTLVKAKTEREEKLDRDRLVVDAVSAAGQVLNGLGMSGLAVRPPPSNKRSL